MKTCSLCLKSQELSSFPKQKLGKQGVAASCKDCRKAIINKQRQVCRQYLLDYFEKTQCSDCGTKDIRVLEFDHVKGTKKDNISDLIVRGCVLKTIQEEILKCEVVCCNCHRIRTLSRQPNWRTQLTFPRG